MWWEVSGRSAAVLRECCFQDLLKTARNILTLFPFSFFSMRFLNFFEVRPYSNANTTTVWDTSCFILSETSDFCCPVGWDCRIHQLLLCKGVRPLPSTSVLDMTLNILMVRFQWWWSFEECGYPFIAIAPRSTLAQRGSTWLGPIYGLNRINGICELKWIVWLNWIAWNRNVVDK